MTSYRDLVDRDCRLVILRVLAGESDGTLNEAVLTSVAETFGHLKSRDYIRAQLRFLEDVGAVRVTEAAGVMIATLTKQGADHVERRIAIDGIARPSPPGG